jgi:hypothetical protein
MSDVIKGFKEGLVRRVVKCRAFSASSRYSSSDVIVSLAIVGSLGPPTPAKRYCGFCNATKFTNEMIENLNDEIRNGHYYFK